MIIYLILEQKVIAFYGHSKNKPHHWYSQFYGIKFTFKKKLVEKSLLQKLEKILTKIDCNMDLDQIENQDFFCAEQFMMMGKVLLFNPENLKDYLKSCKNPSHCKKYGRSREKISNYNDNAWTKVNLAWVTIGNYLKFTQNYQIKKEMLKTKNALLVEGAQNDKIWGVGMYPDDPRINDPKKWNGQNKLGLALMTVRELIKE